MNHTWYIRKIAPGLLNVLCGHNIPQDKEKLKKMFKNSGNLENFEKSEKSTT